MQRTLSDIEKFTYLRSVVTATARDAIAGLVLSSANYGEAIAILEKRFGNKQQIIAKHMDTLLGVEPVRSPHNIQHYGICLIKWKLVYVV